MSKFFSLLSESLTCDLFRFCLSYGTDCAMFARFEHEG